MLSQHGRSQERSVHIEDGKAGRYCDEDIISSYHPPGILERLLAHLLQRKLSSVFMMVGDVQTPVTFESQLSIGVGPAIDTAYGTFIREFSWPRERLISKNPDSLVRS